MKKVVHYLMSNVYPPGIVFAFVGVSAPMKTLICIYWLKNIHDTLFSILNNQDDEF